MRVPYFYNKTTVGIAIGVIVISTITLSFLSYYYTVGGANVMEATLLQSNIKLLEQTVDRIEQKIIDNDRSLYDMVEVDEPAQWVAMSEAIKKAELNVDQVWFIRPEDGRILYPPHDPEIKNLYRTFTASLKVNELNLERLPLNETHHLHKERRDSKYFFASYVLRQNRKEEKILVCFQMNYDKIIALVDKFLRELRQTHYVSIVDFENSGVYGGPLPSPGKYFYESRFPSTFYKWILQIVPREYAELERETQNRRRTNLFFMLLSIFLIFLSLLIIYFGIRKEEQLVRLKEDFISNVSHELKTPLSLIRMFSEILVLGKVKDEEAKREYYRIIDQESDRMSRLITNLLDFASLERGASREHFETTNVASLVSKELETYRYQIQKEGFHLITQVDEKVPDTLADANALSLAFFNLLDNSVKYSVDQKQITVRVSQQDGFIELSVTDRGLGIPKREQQRIFEKFYRGSNAEVRKIRGSGIGLSITKHVAEMHGGQVLVQSEPGKGSTFTLRIPLRQPPLPTQTHAGRG